VAKIFNVLSVVSYNLKNESDAGHRRIELIVTVDPSSRRKAVFLKYMSSDPSARTNVCESKLITEASE